MASTKRISVSLHILLFFMILSVSSTAAWAARRSTTPSLPEGTELQIRLADELTTANAEPGDTFTATLLKPVRVNNRTVLPKDAKVQGRVVDSVSSGRLKRPAAITLELTRVGRSRVSTEPLRFEGKSHKGRNVVLIGGGTAAGAILGGATGGKKGALLGSLIGAGAGMTTAYVTGKKEIVLPVELGLSFVTGNRDDSSRKVKKEDEYAPSDDDADDDIIFSRRERRIIVNWVSNHGTGLPPGLAKRDRLPPGLERQLRRNGRLPPGLQRKLRPFPGALEAKLPGLPRGHRRVFLGKRALILTAAHVILDILDAR